MLLCNGIRSISGPPVIAFKDATSSEYHVHGCDTHLWHIALTAYMRCEASQHPMLSREAHIAVTEHQAIGGVLPDQLFYSWQVQRPLRQHQSKYTTGLCSKTSMCFLNSSCTKLPVMGEFRGFSANCVQLAREHFPHALGMRIWDRRFTRRWNSWHCDMSGSG